MILNFKYGIKKDGLIYGWLNKELYRLPQKIGKRNYPFKKLKQIKIGYNFGYLLNQKKLTFAQLEAETITVNKKINKITSSDCPFH